MADSGLVRGRNLSKAEEERREPPPRETVLQRNSLPYVQWETQLLAN